jgi:hypothetical protein
MGEIVNPGEPVQEVESVEQGPGGEPPEGLFRTTFSDGGSDRDNLVQFLRDLETLLRFITRNPQGIVPDELHDYLEPAWIRVQPRFQVVIDAVLEISDGDLRAAGLAEAELVLKLNAVRRAYRGILNAFRHPRGPKELPGAVSAGLGLADVVGDSIPLIRELIHPILEYKQVIEKSADAIDYVAGSET